MKILKNQHLITIALETEIDKIREMAGYGEKMGSDYFSEQLKILEELLKDVNESILYTKEVE